MITRETVQQLYRACGRTLPYLEILFSKTRPPSPDYFELPKLITEIETALTKIHDELVENTDGESSTTTRST